MLWKNLAIADVDVFSPSVKPGLYNPRNDKDETIRISARIAAIAIAITPVNLLFVRYESLQYC